MMLACKSHLVKKYMAVLKSARRKTYPSTQDLGHGRPPTEPFQMSQVRQHLAYLETPNTDQPTAHKSHGELGATSKKQSILIYATREKVEVM